MVIKVKNRFSVNTQLEKTPYILISICEPHKEYVKLNNETKKMLIDVIYLKFTDEDDIEKAKQIKQDHLLITNEHAQQILDFVKKYESKKPIIVCQCDGGLSRSVGCAAALDRIYNNDDTYWFKFKTPNRLVYRTILNVYYQKEKQWIFQVD